MVLGELPRTSSGVDYIGYTGMTEDGLALGAAVYSGPLGKTAYYPMSPVLVSWKTGKVKFLSDGRKTQDSGGVWDMTASPGWVSWILNSAPDISQANTWSLYTYERATGRTRLVAKAPDVHVKPVPHAWGGTYPRILGDSLYLGAASSINAKGPVDDVYTVPLDGSAPLVSIVHDADNVSADGRDVFYVNGKGGYLYNVETKKTLSIKGLSGKNLGDRCFHEGTLAYGITDGSGQHLKIRRNGHTEDVGVFARLDGMTCSSRWVAYNEQTAEGRSKYYLYDIQRHARYGLPGEVFNVPNGSGSKMILETSDPTTHKFAYDRVIELK